MLGRLSQVVDDLKWKVIEFRDRNKPTGTLERWQGERYHEKVRDILWEMTRSEPERSPGPIETDYTPESSMVPQYTATTNDRRLSVRILETYSGTSVIVNASQGKLDKQQKLIAFPDIHKVRSSLPLDRQDDDSVLEKFVKQKRETLREYKESVSLVISNLGIAVRAEGKLDEEAKERALKNGTYREDNRVMYGDQFQDDLPLHFLREQFGDLMAALPEEVQGMVYARPELPKDSLYDRLSKHFPEKVVDSLLQTLDGNIQNLELITLQTMAGRNGGGVGRVHVKEEIQGEMPFSFEGTRYVFKIDGDFTTAYKSTAAPYAIHERAQTDTLARKLAKRIPKALFPVPESRNGLHVTLMEDMDNKYLTHDTLDWAIMESSVHDGIEMDIVNTIYTTALFHEVMGDIYKDEKEMESMQIIANPGILPVNLREEELKQRFKANKEVYKQVKTKLYRMLQGYDQSRAELLEHELSGRTVAIGDNKKENEVNGHPVDFGSVRLGDEVEDLARALMHRPDICANGQAFKNIVGSYVSMRQKIQLMFKGEITYEADPSLYKHVREQTRLSAIRNAGWALRSPTTRYEFKGFWETAKTLDPNN